MMEEQTAHLSLRAAYQFGAEHGLGDAMEKIRTMSIDWDLPYTSSVRRGYVIELFEKRGILDDFIASHWEVGATERGLSRLRRYLRIKDQFTEYEGNDRPIERDPDDALEFALEAHLRDFLARNLDRIEPGLKLYETEEHEGIEFPVEHGRIDLLAVDNAGKYVVLELKLSRGRNKALGQLLYYMGWVDQHLGNAPCRGLIVASEISNELKVAVARVPGVELARYKMNFSIERTES